MPLQALPSSQNAAQQPCGTTVHPRVGSPPSLVQPRSSLQTSGVPGTHLPPRHVSMPVQRLPSSQSASPAQQFGMPACVHVPPTQTSSVQATPSSQPIAVPAHVPFVHASPPVHASPSSHAVPSSRGITVQPPPLHAPTLQSSSSDVQSIGVPVHAPAVQESFDVQATPSSQTLPSSASWQVDEQQSPSAVLPSSHCSPADTVPLPHGSLSTTTCATTSSLPPAVKLTVAVTVCGPSDNASVENGSATSTPVAPRSNGATVSVRWRTPSTANATDPMPAGGSLKT